MNTHEKINGCWEWKGKISKNGYGWIRNMLAHRCSYEIFKGEIESGKSVCHICDNRKCINPDHLWVGTIKENMQDAKQKGRLADQTGRKHTEETLLKLKNRRFKNPRAQGEKHWNSKLTKQDVIDIKDKLNQKIKLKDIASQYDIDRSHLSRLSRGLAWGHI